jgi:hypothetical protein
LSFDPENSTGESGDSSDLQATKMSLRIILENLPPGLRQQFDSTRGFNVKVNGKEYRIQEAREDRGEALYSSTLMTYDERRTRGKDFDRYISEILASILKKRKAGP